jgi:hypothetical protein
MLLIVAPAYPLSPNCRRAAARIASRVVLVPGRLPVRGVRVRGRSEEAIAETLTDLFNAVKSTL